MGTNDSTTTSTAPPAPEPPPWLGAEDLLGVPGAAVGYDPGRRRLRVTSRHLAALIHLAANGTVHDDLADDLTALRSAGVVAADNTFPGSVAEMLAAWASPAILVNVETTSGTAVVPHAAVVRGRTAWTLEGWPDSHHSDLAPLDPLLLVPALARMVSLLPAPGQDNAPADSTAERAPLRLPVELLDRAYTAVSALPIASRERLLQVVRDAARQLAPDLADADVQRLLDLLAQHRLAWRVTVTWRTEPGRLRPEPVPSDDSTPSSDDKLKGLEIRSLAVVDAGPAGLWRRDQPAEPLVQAPKPGAWLALTPITRSQAWHALTELLPSRHDQVPPHLRPDR